MRPSSTQRFQLPPLKDLEGIAEPLYGTCSTQRIYTGARLHPWDGFTYARAHTPLSPPLEFPSGWETDASRQPTLLGSRVLKIIDSVEQPTTMSVPLAAEKSAGGWFDPSRWLFKLVFQKVGDKSIEELIKLMFHREARPRYGEDHTSARSKRTADQLRSDNSDVQSTYSKQTSSNAHKQQEQDRRWRHRTLQYENDECTGTYVCETAEQMLPLIKETINQMPRDEFTAQESERKVKRLGKDEQLTAAALLPHLSSILIFKLYDALEKLKGRFQRERELRLNAEYRLEQLQRENERLKEQASHSGLERQATSRKRSAGSLEDGSGCEKDYTPRAAKWPRLEHMPRADDRSSRCQFPLSPQSDGGEFTTSCSTSFSSC